MIFDLCHLNLLGKVLGGLTGHLAWKCSFQISDPLVNCYQSVPLIFKLSVGAHHLRGLYQYYKMETLKDLKSLQGYMALFVHSVRCSGPDEGTLTKECTYSLCNEMKGTIRHISECSKRPNCSHRECTDTKILMSHWRSCDAVYCHICSDLEYLFEMDILATENRCCVPIVSTNNQIWNCTVSEWARKQFIIKIMRSICPRKVARFMSRYWYLLLTQYAKEIEFTAFNMASGKSCYINALGNEMFRLQKYFLNEITQAKARKAGISTKSK